MPYEKVHHVWIFHDRVRTGIADYDGVPHYFASPFDYKADDYSDYFLIYPVGTDFLDRALRRDVILREWRTKFDLGLAPIATHPGLGENDPAYRELSEWLDSHICHLTPLPTKYEAAFEVVPGQEALPVGVLRELQVCWRPRAE